MTHGPDPEADTSTAVGTLKRADAEVVGEARWPMAGAVLAAMVLTILLPDAVRAGPRWLLPLIEGVLLERAANAEALAAIADRGNAAALGTRSWWSPRRRAGQS